MPRPHSAHHGTIRGYYEHNRLRTVPCRACLRAWSAYAKGQRDKGRCAKGLGWPLLDPPLAASGPGRGQP